MIWLICSSGVCIRAEKEIFPAIHHREEPYPISFDSALNQNELKTTRIQKEKQPMSKYHTGEFPEMFQKHLTQSNMPDTGYMKNADEKSLAQIHFLGRSQTNDKYSKINEEHSRPTMGHESHYKYKADSPYDQKKRQKTYLQFDDNGNVINLNGDESILQQLLWKLMEGEQMDDKWAQFLEESIMVGSKKDTSADDRPSITLPRSMVNRVIQDRKVFLRFG